MINKMQVSKELLNSVQKICGEVKGQALTDELINSLQDATVSIMEFYEITHFQAIVYAVYLEAKIKDRDIDLERMVDIFGKRLSMIADVNLALDELKAKKLVYYKRHDFSVRRKEDHNNIICVADNAALALMKGDKSLMEVAKVENFLTLLNQIRECIIQRIELVSTTEEMCDELMGILQMNKEFPEVEWLLTFKDLSKYDIAILLNICIETFEGQEEVNIDKMIRETYSEINDRIRYARKVKENKCLLFTHNLIENTEDPFSFVSFVKLTETSLDILLGGNIDVIKRPLKPKFGTLIAPEKIIDEALFYNDSIQKQIDTLVNALQKDNYVRVVNTLKSKGAVPNFSVLFKGPAGTGKTACCYQIAKRTNRYLYFVDLEKISSKWVGESSKNVVALFNEIVEINKYLGEDCCVLLNESDSVISRRINVNSSVDAEKNGVINNFLQEFETYHGIIFLTTNLSDNFDRAFSRRLLYKLDIAAPEPEVRKQILTKVFDDITPETIDKINSQYTLTGGLISNISKKLLVKTLLDDTINKDEYIMELCEEEFVLSRPDRKPIGFVQ